MHLLELKSSETQARLYIHESKVASHDMRLSLQPIFYFKNVSSFLFWYYDIFTWFINDFLS